MNSFISVKGKRLQPSPPYGKLILQATAVLLAAILLLLNLFTYVFSVVRYYGEGMEPSIRDRQLLVLTKTRKVDRGDIVAFYYNNKVLVRRVIGKSGQSIELDRAGTVSVDGIQLNEPYVKALSTGQNNIEYPYQVPYEHCFVMGDNREVAMDSRLAEIGAVPYDRIMGKVILII